MIEQLYDLTCASAQIGLKVSTLQRYIRQGKLRAQLIGKKYYLSVDEIEYFLNESKGKRSKAGRPAKKK